MPQGTQVTQTLQYSSMPQKAPLYTICQLPPNQARVCVYASQDSTLPPNRCVCMCVVCVCVTQDDQQFKFTDFLFWRDVPTWYRLTFMSAGAVMCLSFMKQYLDRWGCMGL